MQACNEEDIGGHIEETVTLLLAEWENIQF